jgi:signal transduction histidine kinase
VKLALGSLAARVALTTALTVIVASGFVALTSQLIADRVIRIREDASLSDAAETLALELRAKGADPHAVAADERHELAHAAIHVAVFEGDVLVAGDPELVPVAASTCRDIRGLRTCARPAKQWTAVVARNQHLLHEQQRLGLIASILAVLLTSVLGALGSISIARVLTGPLTQLTRAVEQLPANDPAAAELGMPANMVEVDALRAVLRDAFVRLGAALNQSRRFASDAAHELRTPLATLLGELELTAEQLNMQNHEGIARAVKLTRRMSALVDRLLILARLDAAPHERERLEVRELVEEAIDTLPAAARLRVMIESSEVSDAAAVDGDRALLVTSFVNALENALKFSKIEVRVALEARSSEVRVSIIDSGSGIAEAERERVFDAFYRTASSRASAVPGHGIGLALIAHVMSLHGGSARFANRERGAQLDLVLPRAL